MQRTSHGCCQGRHCEFLQCGCGMPHKDLPITGADIQAFVGSLHVAARIEDRPSGGLTHVVDDQLAVPSKTVLTVAFPKHAELWIIEQPCQEFIRDRCNGIIAAKAFIQGLRLYTSSPFLVLSVPLWFPDPLFLCLGHRVQVQVKGPRIPYVKHARFGPTGERVWHPAW